MGQHKTNPTAILAKQGRIPPKEKGKRFTQEEILTLLNEAYKKMGIMPLGDVNSYIDELHAKKVRSDLFNEVELPLLKGIKK